ncbi:MAG TPA: mechanosensitive ion channel family protein [Planctomycetota bacterium]|nr:mechanosensitive ion channel family protein [Planctomycetota bacterium]
MEILSKFFEQVEWDTLIFSGLRIVFILAVIWGIVRLVGTLLERVERALSRKAVAAGEVPSEASKRAETLGRLVRQALVTAIWVTGILMVLKEMGVEITPIIASLGVVGLALGFGAQNLVRDVISGFFFILENQVRVGDVAVINGTGGLVESMNFRTIVLRDLAGVVHIFPNGTITTLANMTKGWSAHVFEIGVAYREDLGRVMDVMRKTAASLRDAAAFKPYILGDAEIFGVEDFGQSAVTLKGRIKTVPGKQWEVGREFRRRLKLAFDEAGIEIPFPQMSLTFRVPGGPFGPAVPEGGKPEPGPGPETL